jgi:diacylglycerol kinase family enzyme
MKYGIVVNPAAAITSIDDKRAVIRDVVGVLGPDTLVAGWDTRAPGDFTDCARDLAGKVGILVIAGGDGSLSDAINAVDSETVLALLPMGSGNAMRKTLGLPESIIRSAECIKQGREHMLDLVLCDGKRKGFIASIGIDGYVIGERQKRPELKKYGVMTYLGPMFSALLWEYERTDSRVTIDDDNLTVPGALTLVITKSPYYGYGFKAVPEAKADDGLLHVLLVNAGSFTALLGVAMAACGGNRVGLYRSGRSVHITTDDDVYLQIDGTLQNQDREFDFAVLPKALRMVY